MSRAYRPRLSKDKAVAQRLQDLSTVRQLSDVVEIDNPIATPPPTAAAEATAAGTSGSSLGLPSTPTSTRMSKGRGNTRSRTRNSICTKAAPKMTNNKAKTRASDGASLTPTTAAAPPLGAARNATASSGHGNTTSTTASRGGWSCVSCSFLNVETAKKCSMCGTKNYQPRPRTPMIPLAAGSAEAAGASNGAEGAPEPVARGSQRRRHSGGGPPRERRSPRTSQEDGADAARSKIAGDAQGGEPKGRWAEVGTEATSVDRDAEVSRGCGGGGGGGVSPAPRKRRRNGVLGRTTSARDAGTGGAGLALPVELKVPPAAAAAAATEITTIPTSGKAGSRDAVVATPTVREAERESADEDSGDGDNNGDGGARRALGAVGAQHPNRGQSPPPSPSSSSWCSRKRGKKRARTPPSADAEAGAAAAASSSPVTAAAHPAEPTGGVLPSVTPASDACPSSGPSQSAANSREEAAFSSPREAPREDAMKITPCVVPAMTADSDRELDDGSEASSAPKTTTMRRRRRREGKARTVSMEENKAYRHSSGAASASSPAKLFASYADGHHEWPTTIARVVALDFSGRPLLEVSSVVVTSAGTRGGASNRPGAASASIVVCHTGGVSVWGLTEEEAVCTYLSPSLLNVAKEAVATRFFAAAVIGGDPAEVSPSATRSPGPEEAYILAIGRQETEPGLPIFRLWQQQKKQSQRKHRPLLPLPVQDEGRLKRGAGSIGGGGGGDGGGGIDAMRENSASAATATATATAIPPPSVLTIALKKKFSKFFPPAVPSSIKPCLCVCNYSPPPPTAAAAASATEKVPGAVSGDSSAGAGSAAAGKITAVMALGGKALRLVFRAGSGAQEFKAKALPNGVAESDAVFTSLAPVPSNPFLVCASLPLANAILVWSVRGMDLLFTLPLTALSICIPVTTPAAGAGATATAADGDEMPRLFFAMAGDDGSGDAATANRNSSSGSSSRGRSEDGGPPEGAAIMATATRRSDTRLLCLMATGGRDRSGVCGETTSVGCGLFGVCCSEGDGEGANGAEVSAVRLESSVGADEEQSSARGPDENDRTREVGASHLRRNGSSGAGDGGGDRTCLRYLSDGGDGFVVGVDGQGRIGARSVLTGEPRVFLTRDNAATAVKNDAGEADFFATLDCDPSSGIVALAAAGVKGGVDAATSVELYRLYR